MSLKPTRKRTEFKELRERAGLTLPETADLLKVAADGDQAVARQDRFQPLLALEKRLFAQVRCVLNMRSKAQYSSFASWRSAF